MRGGGGGGRREKKRKGGGGRKRWTCMVSPVVRGPTGSGRGTINGGLTGGG